MKSGFKDPTSIKKQEPEYKPKDGKKAPWDYRAPQYDERTSCFVKAGDKYGIGHKQPIGREGNPKQRVDVMPFGRVNTMRIDES